MISCDAYVEDAKLANITPVYKKEDPLIMKNYHPVSILTSTYKVYETLLLNQLKPSMESILHPHISAFRPKHSCQHVLMHFVNDWKSALEDKKHVGAVQ